METTIRRYAAAAGMLGALAWLIANVGITYGEIEYQHPTRVSPMPEWSVPVGIVAGALLIASFVLFSGPAETRRKLDPGRVIILLGAAISLVPLWPFLFLGPFLVAIGFFAGAVAALTSGRRSVGIALHAIALPLSLPSGIAFDAVGLEGAYGGLLFGAVLAIGIGWRAYETATSLEPAAPASTGATA